MIGADSFIAAHAYVTGRIAIGDDCTVNAFTVVRGNVTMGDAVRIGAHTSILGFNHSMDPSEPVFKQPLLRNCRGTSTWRACKPSRIL
ncbi:serine acetyltransferase [Pseudarthrobacter sp. PvP004]|nr:serine acetyltransferase [Pseudarthrobacter sp. PvP004]